jgi:hypothetical protein
MMRKKQVPSVVFALLGAVSAHSAQAQQQIGNSIEWATLRPPVLTTIASAPVAGGDQQRQAIEHSDAYYTRLAIHRAGSYAILPLFVGEYLLGQKLMSRGDVASWVKPTHGVVAGTIGALFAINTVTGVWNLVESRSEPDGRARRFLHSALMIVADAGFVYTGAIAGEAGGDDDFGEGGGSPNRHRDFAIGSMAIASTATLIMWLWK